MSDHAPLTQQQMEATLRASAEQVATELAGTINGWMPPRFVSCDLESRTYVCFYEMRKEYANPGGTLHGGLTGVIFDTAMGHLAHCYTGHMTPTISMTISYLLPIPVDRPVFVRVHMDKPGATVAYVSAEAYTADAPETILATSSGVYFTGTVAH